MLNQFPAAQGLYDPSRDDKDSCGVGFVADKSGRQSHGVLRKAIKALVNLAHRGAVSSDGLTGDGAGIMTQLPIRLLQRELRNQGKRDIASENLAVGMLFLPSEPDAAVQVRQLVERHLMGVNIKLLCWRHVPIAPQSLGEGAYASLPRIEQVICAKPSEWDQLTAERQLYLARRRIEVEVEKLGLPFYVPSLSCRTISYKGLMVPAQLDRFYLDLADNDYETSIALFHQRYSTNTFPSWFLAQPFRMLAHNGEINTLRGNINRMAVREPELSSDVWKEQLAELLPVIQKGGSDSSALDNVLELLTLSGRELMHSMTMLVPEAYRTSLDTDDDIKAFYEYHHLIAEPWDGPAALAFTDGRYAACCLDRNGLRPMRYWITHDDLVIAGSEAGVVPLPDEQIKEKGRLGPGKMLAVDTVTHEILLDGEIKRRLAKPEYREWRNKHLSWKDKLHSPSDTDEGARLVAMTDQLVRLQRTFGYGEEELDRVLVPMLSDGKEPVGSMGDDTPIAAFSQHPQMMYRYFKQRFAQVTNPPIDPLREQVVMSLNTAIGIRPPYFDDRPGVSMLFKFTSPVITEEELNQLLNAQQTDPRFRTTVLSCVFSASEGPSGMERALHALCAQAVTAVNEGCDFLILSDRETDANRAPIPMLLAVSHIHHTLIAQKKRMRPTIVCDSGEVREDHQFACLIGYSAALVHPYLAFATVRQLALKQPGATAESAKIAMENYQHAVEKGLRKIMSKMGISTVSSYRGAQTFEVLGLEKQLVDKYFPGTTARLGGVTMTDLAVDVLRLHEEAHGENPKLRELGTFRFTGGGEFHALNPYVYKSLHKAVRSGDRTEFAEYTRVADTRPPCHIRDLLAFNSTRAPIPLDEVEPAEQIVSRFCTQAMSHGALSREAHEVLSIAMNKLHGKSNSGEGGEDSIRFSAYLEDRRDLSEAPWHPQQGDLGNSAIKQIASGRFGVTPRYVMNARELEIKMAQGSKPGEGGQIPGVKVSGEIARIRGAVPGTTLISPPPHHDIYSIEDLAQLIYDLKRTNAEAKVCVKLVATTGIGTIAAGVAKGYADRIQVSGCDGGTGASPLSSIRHAGLPWELGLAEAQQVLVLNNLRGRIKLRVDGGFKTGRDVVIAAMLGAEEFGFGTIAVIAIGCMMARKCHLNTCPVGIASQKPELRKKFPGTPEHVINFMLFTAEEVRLILAELGYRSLDEVIGHVELLKKRDDAGSILPRAKQIDYTDLLFDPYKEAVTDNRPRKCAQGRNDRPGYDIPLDEILHRELKSYVAKRKPVERRFWINNRERSVGARLSGEIAKQHPDHRLPADTIKIRFVGTAGQSFGLFCNHGMKLILEGECQDYVGKGMHGGTIVVRPPSTSKRLTQDNVIIGNTVLYGATGGQLFAAGRAGERFAVRNSGAVAVVEGCGDHGCEYMTGGAAIILGDIGRNFAAGMSGGVVYLFDPQRRWHSPDERDAKTGLIRTFINLDMVTVEAVNPGSANQPTVDAQLIKQLITDHANHTDSDRAREILYGWHTFQHAFWKITPKPESKESASATDRDFFALRAMEQVGYNLPVATAGVDGNGSIPNGQNGHSVHESRDWPNRPSHVKN